MLDTSDELPRAGLTVVGRKEFVPLKDLRWDLDILHSVLELTITQTYHNTGDSDIECEYAFPVDQRAAVAGLTIRINNKVLDSRVYQKEKAEQKYVDSIARGSGAYLMQYDANQQELLRVTVGNLLVGKEATVTIRLIQKLELGQDGLWVVRVPTSFTPRYHYPKSSSGSPPHAKSQPITFDAPKYKWNVHGKISCESAVRQPREVSKMVCDSHLIGSNIGPEGVATFSLLGPADGKPEQLPDHDFVLRFGTTGSSAPNLIIQKEATWDHYACLLTFAPAFAPTSDVGIGEFIFLLDCSGSMDGANIDMARESVRLFVRSLSPDCLFNVYFFGSTFESVFSEGSAKYGDKTAEEALGRIDKQSANLCGTDIFAPLNDIFKGEEKSGYPRNVFLVTDGDVEEEDKVISLIKQQRAKTRVHTIGIGSGISKRLIVEGARAGNGTSEFATESENLSPKVIGMLARASKPALSDPRVRWPDGVDVMRQSLPATVYQNEPFVLLALTKGPPKGIISVDAVDTSTGKPVKLTADVTDDSTKSMRSGKSLYQLAARQIMSDYELAATEEESLSLRYQVLSGRTAFFVEERLPEHKATSDLQHLRVPIAITRNSDMRPANTYFSRVAVPSQCYSGRSMPVASEDCRYNCVLANESFEINQRLIGTGGYIMKSDNASRSRRRSRSRSRSWNRSGSGSGSMSRSRSRSRSPVKGKAPERHVSSPAKKKKAAKSLIELQSTSGSWEMDALLQFFPHKFSSVKNLLATVPTRLKKLAGDSKVAAATVWATLIARQLVKAEKKAEYELIVKKAETWLRRAGVEPGDFDQEVAAICAST